MLEDGKPNVRDVAVLELRPIGVILSDYVELASFSVLHLHLDRLCMGVIRIALLRVVELGDGVRVRLSDVILVEVDGSAEIGRASCRERV